MHRAVLGLIALLAASFVGTSRAQADFRVCNTTRIRLETAIGFKERGNGWIAEGWWPIDAGDCKTLIRGPLTKRYFYIYANGGRANPNATFSGRTPFCIQMRKFRLYQAQYGKNSKADCSAAGLDWAGFFTADTHKSKNHTVQLNAPAGSTADGPPAPSPVPDGPRRPPRGAPAGGGAGSACQRFPNLC